MSDNQAEVIVGAFWQCLLRWAIFLYQRVWQCLFCWAIFLSQRVWLLIVLLCDHICVCASRARNMRLGIGTFRQSAINGWRGSNDDGTLPKMDELCGLLVDADLYDVCNDAHVFSGGMLRALTFR